MSNLKSQTPHKGGERNVKSKKTESEMNHLTPIFKTPQKEEPVK